jgi:hypothetical protein
MTPEPGNLPPRHRPPGQVAERPAAVGDLLAAHAAARERTADEHMFTVSSWNGARMGTFRLQLFTAPGTRPVAVATQGPAEGGRLADWAEDYAAEVWRRHFPDSAEPPVWITLQLSPGSREGRRPQRFSLVTFRLWEPYELSWPQRFAMTDADVAALAGASVDRDRGDGYQPWPVEPDPEPVWRVAWTILLPRPEGMDRGCITAAAPWWRRLARQVIPLRTTRDCCYYHRVNWRQVSAVAIRVTRQTRREGLVGEAFGDRVAVLAAAQGLPAREEEALADLLADHSALQPGPRLRLRAGYTNGRHRTTAMLDVGVRRTIIVRWRYPS